MKNKFQFIPLSIVIIALFLFQSCHKQDSGMITSVDLMSQNGTTDLASENAAFSSGQPAAFENTISLDQFNKWNKAWKSHWNDRYISNFTMPLSNLQNLVNTPGVVSARFYLGYSEEDSNPHLTLVGVNASGESMLSESNQIYNFTRPCPNGCPKVAPEDFEFPKSGLTDPPANTIPLATFDEWNTSWESRWDDQYIEHFTMPLSNLQNLVKTNGVVEARLYLGYSEAYGSPHLTLVGVDANGYSMVGKNAYVYDTSRPCPPFCSESVK